MARPLLFARVIAFVTAAIVAVNILVGAMTEPMFLIPDWVLAGLLAVAALLPERRGGAIALVATLGFALGVFSVAVSGQALAGEINGSLVLLMAFDGLALTIAARVLRPSAAAA